MVVLAEEGLGASRRSARSRRCAVQSGVALAVYPALAHAHPPTSVIAVLLPLGPRRQRCASLRSLSTV
jgi:hypothetical protein